MQSGLHPMVRVTRQYSQTAERVFDAWLDPEKAGKFLFATASGQMVRAETDARVGGRFRFVDRRDGMDVEHNGAYLEIDRPRRLVFAFTVSGHEDTASRVSIDIAPRGNGCELTLIHEGVPAEYAERTQAGWTTILDNLAAALAP
jgi:uncharacterized protein YndB with AHSA1/START domain